MLLIHALPDNLSDDGLRKALGRHYGQIIGALSMFEALGPLVARGHVPIAMYSDFYRGVTVLCWHKMRRSIEEQRAMGWPNLFEWLQWLSDRMEERRPPSGDRPAFERYATWTKSSDFQIL